MNALQPTLPAPQVVGDRLHAESLVDVGRAESFANGCGEDLETLFRRVGPVRSGHGSVLTKAGSPSSQISITSSGDRGSGRRASSPDVVKRRYQPHAHERSHLSTVCPQNRVLYPLFGFSSGRYPVGMATSRHPQEPRQHANPPAYAGGSSRATMRGMEVQLTPRPSRHAARFPNTIRESRLKAGLSQRKLAAMLGRSKDAVSSWVRGLNLPSVPLLMRMAKILDTLAEALNRDYYQRFPQSQENTDATAA